MLSAQALRSMPIIRLEGAAPGVAADDVLAVEESLEIRVGCSGLAHAWQRPGLNPDRRRTAKSYSAMRMSIYAGTLAE
jgi:hypothetical protein